MYSSWELEVVSSSWSFTIAAANVTPIKSESTVFISLFPVVTVTVVYL